MEVFQDLQWAMDGFDHLHARRPVGMNGPLRIPITEIESYCRLCEFKYLKRRLFLYYISEMDEVYMAFVAEKQAAAEAEQKRLAQQRALQGRRS